MIKKRDKDGNIVLGIPTAPLNSEPLPPVEGVIETRTYDYHIEGLPLNATDTDAINAAIRDLTKQGKLYPHKISNGVHTFEELYMVIAALKKGIEVEGSKEFMKPLEEL